MMMNATNNFVMDEYYATTTQYNDSNDTYENMTDEANRFILPVWRQALWSILYTGMVIVATGGNLIVIWIVLAHKRMRTVTNYFLLNLSIADTMVSTLNVTFNFVYMLNAHWPFGKLYCKISQFTAVLSICASVFSLMAISIDRYMAIMTPLKPRMGRTITLSLAISTWLLGILISSPYLYVFTTYTLVFHGGTERVICYGEWPDGSTGESQLEYWYNVAFLFVTYVVPIVSMTYTYARIGLELWGSQSIGECTQRQMDNIKSKRRVVKMMVVVVIIFAVCWLPFHLYFILTAHFPEINNSTYIQETYLAIYWLAMSNSMYNPMIYCWMNARFRRGFKQFFSCLPCVDAAGTAFTRREVFTSRRRSFAGSPDHNRIMRNGTVRTYLNVNHQHQQQPTDEFSVCSPIADEMHRAGGAVGGAGRVTKRWPNHHHHNNHHHPADAQQQSNNGSSEWQQHQQWKQTTVEEECIPTSRNQPQQRTWI